MIDCLLFVLTLISALGCGLVAGIFFAFSAFIMKALSRLPPAQGIAAMQPINVAVINPWFLTAFIGTGAACVLLAVSSLFMWHKPAAVDPASADAARLWAGYVASWTARNHVRTAAALAAATSLTVALSFLATAYLQKTPSGPS